MKKLLLALAAGLIAAGPAHAISRYNINNKSCHQVQDIVHSHGAVILRYTSTSGSGMTLYDRYVADGNFCEHPLVMKRTTVPTADTRHCPVYFCKQSNWLKD